MITRSRGGTAFSERHSASNVLPSSSHSIRDATPPDIMYGLNARRISLTRNKRPHGVTISQFTQQRVEEPARNAQCSHLARATDDRDSFYRSIARGLERKPRVSRLRRKVRAK